MHQSPAMLDETLARPGGLIGRPPRLQFRLMLTDQFASELGLRGIILLAAGASASRNLASIRGLMG